MPHYRTLGEIPAKRHSEYRQSDGRRYFEELMGQRGFSSDSSLLYHRHSPSAVARISVAEGVASSDPSALDSPLRPHHMRTTQLEEPSTQDDVVGGRRRLLTNADVTLGWVDASVDGPLYRNVVGDELIFVQRGTATVESVFGPLSVGPGDYVVIPAGVTHRFADVAGMGALVIEAAGHVGPPQRYLSPRGQFLEHSPFCERDVRSPVDTLIVEGTDVDVLVRTAGGYSWHTHAHHPFDVDGWDGCVYPWAFNIADFEPIVGSIHQPPPVHQTFEGPGFVVCSFVPRLFDFHPDAVKVPYHHANTDSDEVLFYSAGDFMSRAGSGIGVGSISFHPAGFIHGPQPGSVEASVDLDRTEETAVMIDTFRPLEMTPLAHSISDPDYAQSWLPATE